MGTAPLTDGQACNEVKFDNNWFAFCLHEGDYGINAPDGVGSVVIDLESTYDINSIKVNTVVGENVEGSGINCPEKISAYISDTADGDFTYLGDLTIGESANSVTWAELSAEATGRFVKIEVILNGNFAFINEIAVYGEDASQDAPSKPTNDQVDPDPTPDPDPEPPFDELLGEENEDSEFTMDITAPESYVAGEEVVVTVTVNNANIALQHVNGRLYFDTDVLGFDFGLTEDKELRGSLVDFAEWEDFCALEKDENGNWYVHIQALTAGYYDNDGNVIYTDNLNDGDITFNIKFIALEDATYDTIVYIPHNTVIGYCINPRTYEIFCYLGNGSLAEIPEGESGVHIPGL